LYLLGFTSTPLERRRLTVHVLGVDAAIELLPVFGELALLLPNTDLDLVFFGPDVIKLMDKAKGRPSCLASRPFAYMYQAPKVSGAGTIRIELSRSESFYGDSDIELCREEKPNAIVAFNAGFNINTQWRSVVFASRAFAIPFAITGFNELGLRTDIRLILRQIHLLQPLCWPTVSLTVPEQRRINGMEGASYPIDLNPFMRPGPTPRRVHPGPGSINGFTLVVTPGGLV